MVINIRKTMVTVLIAALSTNAFAEGKATDNGYPYSQVPFTAVNISRGKRYVYKWNHLK